MGRESVVIYRSFIEAIGALPDEYRMKAYDALFALALDGKSYEGDNPIIKAVMLLVAPQIEANNKRYENGKKGGRPPKNNQEETESKPNDNQTETEPEPNVNVNDNVNVNVNDIESTPKPPKRGKRFTPPSLEEVQAYCTERMNAVNPQQFHDFYSAKDWMVGKNRMKDWKACVRTWERRRDEEYGAKRYGANGIELKSGFEDDLKEVFR